MKIYLASFFNKKIQNMDNVERLSVARYQPRQFKYPEIKVFQPIYRGEAIRKEPGEYIEKYFKVLRENYEEICDWFFSRDKDVALLCWCNENGLQGHKHVMCHTILIGWMLEDLNNDLSNQFIYEDGRNADWFGDTVPRTYGETRMIEILEGG